MTLKNEPGDQSWRTPRWLFRYLEDHVVKQKFKLDASATKANALCKKYYDERANGLLQEWISPTFVNPGYSQFNMWIAKAAHEGAHRKVVSCLIGPKGCSQNWFHKHAKLGRVYAPDRRLAFLRPDTGYATETAREDSMIYVLGPGFWNLSNHSFDLRPLLIRDVWPS